MKLRRWEIALLASMLATLLFCALPIAAQARLAGKLVRLHVVANSDRAADQALKLRVRDAVLAEAGAAAAVDDALLMRMERAAQRTLRAAGCGDGVRVARTRMWFDTRDYGTFALPAGWYDAVRVTIGAGAGHNWWCVLFPPLCTGSSAADVEQLARAAGLTGEEVAFLCGDGETAVIRFRVVELWDKLLHRLRENG